jgi:hypothetical protein
MFKPIETKLAGVTFDDCQSNILKWGCADIGTFAMDREADNPYDPNAIRVSLFGIHNVGYLPTDVAQMIAPLMDNGRHFLAEFVRVTRYPPHERIGMIVRIVETTNLPMT